MVFCKNKNKVFIYGTDFQYRVVFCNNKKKVIYGTDFSVSAILLFAFPSTSSMKKNSKIQNPPLPPPFNSTDALLSSSPKAKTQMEESSLPPLLPLFLKIPLQAHTSPSHALPGPRSQHLLLQFNHPILRRRPESPKFSLHLQPDAPQFHLPQSLYLSFCPQSLRPSFVFG